VHTELSSAHTRKKKLEDRITKSVERETEEKQMNERKRAEEKFTTITELLDAFDILSDKDLKEIFNFIDNNIIKEYLDESQYRSSLDQIKEFLEDKF